MGTNIGEKSRARRGAVLDLKRAILDRIRRDKLILVWSPNDFLDLGARSAVDKALQRSQILAPSGVSIADYTIYRHRDLLSFRGRLR